MGEVADAPLPASPDSPRRFVGGRNRAGGGLLFSVGCRRLGGPAQHGLSPGLDPVDNAPRPLELLSDQGQATENGEHTGAGQDEHGHASQDEDESPNYSCDPDHDWKRSRNWEMGE